MKRDGLKVNVNFSIKMNYLSYIPVAAVVAIKIKMMIYVKYTENVKINLSKINK